MRVLILAVPPLIPLIRQDLGMTETQVGLLIGMPLIVFALISVPGSVLTARFGAVAALTLGLVIAAGAAAARGAAANVWMLYGATVVMGMGVAIIQPAIPTLIRQWAAHRLGLATAVSSNGILIGVAAAPALTHPLVLPMVDQSWRGSFVVWAVPVAVIAAIFLAAAHWLPKPHDLTTPRRWWPDWGSPLTWLLGITFGCNNCLFFGTNAFLADFLVHHDRTDLVGAAVGFLNSAQLAASFVLITFARRLEGQPLSFIGGGAAGVVGVVGIVFGSDYWVIAAAALVGFSLGISFALVLALPARLSAANDVHRVSAGMFTISFSMAVVIPTLSGALWDWTGVPAIAFVPLAICSALLGVFGAFLTTHR
ncbi:MAG: MFS transporter, partial [Hyphomicrobiales bacterium]|nr:MFS transporter [Hyphomicrobiales bacterium]